MTRNQRTIFIAGAVVVALAATAVASSYFTRSSLQPPEQTASVQPVRHAAPHRVPPQQVAANRPACNDHNIVGTVGGALAGGLVGNQFGKGTGRNAATVVGAAGGAYLGNQYIPTNGAACN